MNGQLGVRIVLLEGCAEAFVEVGLETFTWSDSCNMRYCILSLGESSCASWDAAVMNEPG